MFTEVTARLDRLTLSGGARVDRWRMSDGELVEREIASGSLLRDEQYPSRSDWRPTARAGAVYEFNGGFSLRSAAYLGWRLPTLNELFRPFRAGADATAANPYLKPERLARYEDEMRTRLDRTVWNAGCHNWYRDEAGRNTNNWPGFTVEYNLRTRKPDLDDYDLV